MKKTKIIIAALLCAFALLSCAGAVWLIVNGDSLFAEEPREEPVLPEEQAETLSKETTEEEEHTEFQGTEPAEETPREPAAVESAPEEPPAQTGAAHVSGAEYRIPSEGYSPVYATVWPIKDLKVYAGTDKKQTLGTAPAFTMYTVLEEDSEQKLFKIRYNAEQFGYIESSYCLINLPEYIGDLCAYDITNSYNSLYMIHEYEIPGVTGTVIPGYENVHLADGSFLVPLLYPTAQKLIEAAKLALEQGWRIKIYDSYRPKIATNYIYYTSMAIINNPLPANTYTGQQVSLPSVPAAKEGEVQRTSLIYLDLVELNGWKLSSFLAAGASFHNKGTAMDLTFEDAVTGEDIVSQTRMHDLSAYSTTHSNNADTKQLLKLMESCKLMDIVSEWWHFQDNENQKALSLPFAEKGVSAEGWVADAGGVGYRLADGTRLKNGTLVTQEGTFQFDAEGHLIEEGNDAEA